MPCTPPLKVGTVSRFFEGSLGVAFTTSIIVESKVPSTFKRVMLFMLALFVRLVLKDEKLPAIKNLPFSLPLEILVTELTR
ncbi:hypothetical protein D3C87_1658740 [compost metagenome]